MAVIHADLVGPLLEGQNSQNQRGFQYILFIVDLATHYLWLFPLHYKTVAAAVFDEVIPRICLACHFDTQGKRIHGRGSGMPPQTSAYRPQTDATCEQMHFSVQGRI